MRFVLLGFDAVAEADESAAGDPALDAYRSQLIRAGVLLAAEELQPADRGVRVAFDGERRILDRPAGGAASRVWMLDTAGEEEAVEWARRMPLTSGAVEVRRVTGGGR